MNVPFAVDTARFVHETVDGETMILDTVHGRLLLLTGTAALLLDRLGIPTQLVNQVSDRYGADAAAQAREFFQEMAAIGVIVPVETSPARADGEADWPAHFTQPAFECYDDIADIISMDPLHEVDQAFGWPRPPVAPPA
jgi:hypothetical protein